MPKIKLCPTADRLLVRRAEPEKTSPGGIVLPDSSAPKPARGEVLAVGPGRRNDAGVLQPLSIAVGELVHFNSYAGMEIELHGQKFLVLAEHEVACVEQPA